MVSRDVNAAMEEWIIQNCNSDSITFLFEVRSPEPPLHYVSESVMKEAMGKCPPNKVMTIGSKEAGYEVYCQMEERRCLADIKPAAGNAQAYNQNQRAMNRYACTSTMQANLMIMAENVRLALFNENDLFIYLKRVYPQETTKLTQKGQ